MTRSHRHWSDSHQSPYACRCISRLAVFLANHIANAEAEQSSNEESARCVAEWSASEPQNDAHNEKDCGHYRNPKLPSLPKLFHIIFILRYIFTALIAPMMISTTSNIQKPHEQNL